jgi:hypothetical protein
MITQFLTDFTKSALSGRFSIVSVHALTNCCVRDDAAFAIFTAQTDAGILALLVDAGQVAWAL